MKKAIKTAAYIILALAAASCAKAVSQGPNAANERYFNAWMELNHPEAVPTDLGVYVLPGTKEGTGDAVKMGGQAHVDYIIKDLEGNISSYTDKETAKQLGTYDTTRYYGPRFVSTVENNIQAGLADILIGMKPGGSKKVIIPGWLMTYSTYGTPQEYIDNSSSGTNTIYEITVRAFTDDIQKFEADSIDRYIKNHQEGKGAAEDGFIFNDRMTQPLKDTAFFFQPLSAKAEPEKEFKADTTIYINYTGRLLNGLVFDSSIEKVAKDNGLYSASRTYGPKKITWAEKYTDIQMEGSSVIAGFAQTIWQMKDYEKGVGIFYSPLGYSYSGSGASIPGYSPLIFEIEIVEKPEE